MVLRGGRYRKGGALRRVDDSVLGEGLEGHVVRGYFVEREIDRIQCYELVMLERGMAGDRSCSMESAGFVWTVIGSA